MDRFKAREIEGHFQLFVVRPKLDEVVIHHCCSAKEPIFTSAGNWGHPLPSATGIEKAVQRFLSFPEQTTLSALFTSEPILGSISATSIAMTAITTINSTRVKAWRSKDFTCGESLTLKDIY